MSFPSNRGDFQGSWIQQPTVLFRTACSGLQRAIVFFTSKTTIFSNSYSLAAEECAATRTKQSGRGLEAPRIFDKPMSG